jgi:hypothetical protein
MGATVRDRRRISEMATLVRDANVRRVKRARRESDA